MWAVLGWLIFVNVETGFYVEGVFLKKMPEVSRKCRHDLYVTARLRLGNQTPVSGISGRNWALKIHVSVSWVMIYFAHLMMMVMIYFAIITT